MTNSSSWKSKAITIIAVFFFSFIGINNKAFSAPDGKALFKSNCAACHHADKTLVGPALRGVAKRWADAGAKDEIYNWIKDPKATAETVPYAKTLKETWDAKGAALMPSQAVSNEDIDAILAYIESYTDGAAPATASGAPQAHPEAFFADKKVQSHRWLWVIVLGVVFTIIALTLGNVRRQLRAVRLASLNRPVPDQSIISEIRAWMWKNKKLVSVIGLFIVFFFVCVGWYSLKDIGVFEGYKPKQPIWFSHEIHAGIDKIDCQYCHSGVEKSRHATLPEPMVCMNCHKAIQQGTLTGTEEISKIYQATGFDPATSSFSGKTQPIKWVKVHALPDHVYFNHSQHVVAGKVDCKQCHGEMNKIDVARIQPVSVLNAIEGNIKIEGRPTLTMGWCIDCHNQAKVNMDGNGYYDEMKKRLLLNKSLYEKHLADEKISVREMGGWECSKCHY